MNPGNVVTLTESLYKFISMIVKVIKLYWIDLEKYKQISGEKTGAFAMSDINLFKSQSIRKWNLIKD